MKLCLISDLHLDFMADDGNTVFAELPKDIDLLCIAGDTCEANNYDTVNMYWSNISKRFPRVVFVAGNHEYVGSTFADTDEYLAAVTGDFPNLTFLERDSIDLNDGKKLHGATLWYPDHENNRYYSDSMIDFSEIRGFVPEVYYRHQQSVEYFRKNVLQGDIIMTHHAPHKNSISERFARSALNRFFVSDQSQIILENRPAYWFHGHTHSQFDYTIDQTRVICSPIGYPHEGIDIEPMIIET